MWKVGDSVRTIDGATTGRILRIAGAFCVLVDVMVNGQRLHGEYRCHKAHLLILP